MRKNTHIMIDLETLGTSVDAVFISIGAVIFDPESGSIGATFYTNVDWQSSLVEGRRMDADTIKWWFKQSDEARAAVVEGGPNLQNALCLLTEFLDNVKRERGTPIVWANGPTFDIAMLEHAYKSFKYIVPWKFYNVRDVRTIKDLGKARVDENIFKMPIGKSHNALADAVHQANYVSKLYQAIVEPSF